MRQGVIVMSKQDQYRHQIIGDFLAGKVKRSEAAEVLKVRERSVSRIAARVRNQGLWGIKHGNCGKSPSNLIPQTFKAQVLELVRTRYFDFNLTHCLERLKADHGIELKRETFRKWCHQAGLVKNRQKRRSIARKYRERMPSRGMLIQLDGSPHRWNGTEESWTLIAAIDDATSEMLYGEFFHSEATLNCMQVLKRIIEIHGLPECLYVDRAGIYGGAKRQLFSQFSRACEELGIRVLFASSPQGKGRIERSFKTLQDRLIPELRIRNIKSMPRANEFLQREFLPNFWNQTYRVAARDPECRFKPLPLSCAVEEVLCLKEWRAIAADQTLNWEGKRWLVNLNSRYSLRGQKAEIRTYINLKQQVFFAGVPVELLEVPNPVRKIA